jgi:hypothetical protein
VNPIDLLEERLQEIGHITCGPEDPPVAIERVSRNGMMFTVELRRGGQYRKVQLDMTEMQHEELNFVVTVVLTNLVESFLTGR